MKNNERIKIAILVPALSVGGSSDVVCRLAQLFKSDDRFVVRVFSFFSWGDDKYLNSLKSSGVDVTFLGKNKKIDFPFWRKLKKELMRFSPDIAWTHLTAPAHFVLSGAFKALPKCRVVHTIHSYPKKDLPWVYRLILKRYIRKGKIELVGVSEPVSLMAAKCYGIKEDRVTTILNGVPLNENRDLPSAKKYDFLCVGRFDPIKNFPDLIDAFSLLNPVDKQLKLCICGYGEEEKKIKQKIESLGLAKNVFLFGKDADVSELYKQSKIFCLFSSREGHPITVLEAKSFGLPVIATSVGGVPQMIKDGEDGLIIRTPHDIKSESAAMKNLVSDNEKLARMSDLSYKSSFQFGVKKTFPLYATLFLKNSEIENRKDRFYFFVGNAFPEELDDYFKQKYYKVADVSSLIYGRSLLEGLTQVVDPSHLLVFSVPQVGVFPKTCKKNYVSYETKEPMFVPVPFFSLFCVKHLSQFASLKCKLKEKLKTLPKDSRVHVIIQSLYLPYLSAVFKLMKRKENRFFVTCVVPDLPEFVGSERRPFLVRQARKIYVKKTYDYLKRVTDNFVLFSPFMKERISCDEHNSFVSVGCLPSTELIPSSMEPGKVVFAGKLCEENLVKMAIDAFCLTSDPSYTFDVIGDGEDMPYVLEAAKKDPRIKVHGFLSPDEVGEFYKRASAILCTRKDTKKLSYAFPSKLINALRFEVPVISYVLPTFDENLKKCVASPKEETPESLKSAIEDALKNRYVDKAARAAFLESVNNKRLAQQIVDSSTFDE